MKEKTIDRILIILFIMMVIGFISNLFLKTFIPILIIECIMVFFILYELIRFYDSSIKKTALYLFLVISFATLLDPLLMKIINYSIDVTFKLSVWVNSVVGFFGFLGIFIGYSVKKKSKR